MKNYPTSNFKWRGAFLIALALLLSSHLCLADSESDQGWIIKRGKNGEIIKIPKKQVFKFQGSEVEGAGVKPSESILGSRTGAREQNLIPVRASFKRESLDSVGVYNVK